MARYWAGYRRHKTRAGGDALEGLISANAPQEKIDEFTKLIDAAQSEDYEIWEDNKSTANFFLEISTQWIVSSGGERVGLPHQVIESTMNMKNIYGRRTRAQLYDKIKMMEIVALQTLQELKTECQR